MPYSFPQPPRAVASNPLPPVLPTTAPADEAGGRGQRFIATDKVYWIDPVDGWQLFQHEYQDGDGFWRAEYAARRDGVEMPLHVSRLRFTPSNDRFAWLVRNGFPKRPGKILGPWDDTDIEARIAGEVH